MFKNRGIAFKLIFFFCVSNALIFLLILSYNYRFSKKMIEKNVENSSKNLAHSTVNRIEIVLQSVQKIPENLAYFLERGSYTKKELLELLRTLVERNPEIYGAAISFEPYAYEKNSRYFAPYFYKDGGKVKFSYLGNESYRYFYLDWYQIPKELGRPGWTEPYFDKGGGNILMATYSVPFYANIDGKRRFMGIVTADISLEWMRNMVSSIKILKTGYASLLSKNGTFITHPSKKLIMNESIFSIAEERGDSGMRETGKKMIRGETGFFPYKNIYGQECWVYYAPVQSSGWSLSVLFPMDELMEDIVSLNRTVLFGGIAGILLLSLAVVFIAHSITKPLRAFSKAAGEIGSGNLDVELPSVRTGDEVGRLANAFQHMKVSLKDYIAKLTDTTAAKERIESELKIAHDIQMSILPKIFPPFPDKPDTFDLYAVIKPAKEVGGDFYDFFYIDDSHFCFVIGDVSGKGVPASLFMAVTKTLIKGNATGIADPGRILAKVNNDLSDGNDACMFVTIFLSILNTKTGEILYANGGHNPPMIINGGGAAEFLNVPKDIVVGAVAGYAYKTDSATLKQGDSIFTYTDGVTEAMNGKEELFSEKRLHEKLSSTQGKTARDVISYVMEETALFTGDAPQSDDITMMMLQYKGGK